MPTLQSLVNSRIKTTYSSTEEATEVFGYLAGLLKEASKHTIEAQRDQKVQIYDKVIASK